MCVYKRLLLVLLALAGITTARAQSSYIMQNSEKILVGLTNPDTLMRPEFKWFSEGVQAYKPDAKAIKKLQPLKDQIYVEVYFGSWCDDTHNLLPKFYRIIKDLGVNPNHITLRALDRNKHDESNFAVPGVNNVPYFIFKYGSLETGKIIESVSKSVEDSMLEIYKPYTR